MTTFTLVTDNTITAFAATDQVPEGQERFTSQKELAKLTVKWSMTRIASVWNSFAGAVPFDELKPVNKFTDRKAAVARIWRAIQRLAPQPTTAKECATAARRAAPVGSKKAKATKEATRDSGAPTAREGSKKAIVLDMLKRPDGATLDSIVATTGWQKKTVYGFISGTIGKKMELTVDSIRSNEGVRSYRIVA